MRMKMKGIKLFRVLFNSTATNTFSQLHKFSLLLIHNLTMADTSQTIPAKITSINNRLCKTTLSLHHLLSQIFSILSEETLEPFLLPNHKRIFTHSIQVRIFTNNTLHSRSDNLYFSVHRLSKVLG